MEVINLTKKLISIPSYVDDGSSEIKVAEFVFNYLKKFKFLKVEKQFIDDSGRFNVIAKTKGGSRLFLAGHLDTVQKRFGWKTEQLKPVIKGDKLYGLGAADMKAGVAVILSSIKSFENIEGVTFLFYCDEEYYFKGMKKFCSTYKNKKITGLGIIPEPSQLKIWHAHRGVIEIEFAIKGETAHSAHYNKGKNAIKIMNSLLLDLEEWVESKKSKVLGKSSLNIAYIKGGLNLGKKADNVILGKNGNNVADYAEAKIEIRNAVKSLNASSVIGFLRKKIKQKQVEEVFFTKINDFGKMETPKERLKDLEVLVKNNFENCEYIDPRFKGYGDGQILNKTFGLPVVYIGPVGSNMHAANEWVSIKSIKILEKLFIDIIDSFTSSRRVL